MANEITTTSVNDVTNSALVEPVIIMALSEQPGIAVQSCREFNAIGKPTNVLTIPKQDSFWGSANDDGVGVDTEFNGTEATALSNTAVTTSAATLTAAEYGVAHQVTDNVGEDSAIDALELMNLFTGSMLKALQLALDDDFCALFASLSQSVGTTTADLTVANMLAAHSGIRTRGTVADAVQYVLDTQQAEDLDTALSGANAAAAIYALSADRIINYQPSGDYGMSPSRKVASFRGADVFVTGLTDTANAGADVVGACFCPTTALNDATGATTFGLIWKRLPRFEAQRQAKSRAQDIVMSMRAGVAELQDGSGTKIVTDAP
jgi:hypothetical protein